MRFWLKDGERRPDPEPVQSDDRKAILVGLVACFYSTPELGEWAEHVVRSARSHVS